MDAWRTIYLTAINRLPEKWCDEETRVCTISADRVIAGNPKFAPIIFENGKWSTLEITKSTILSQK